MKPRTVVITGGTRGMGRETSMAFGRAGYFVIALYGSDQAAAGELQDSFTTSKISGCVLKHDITNEESGAGIWSRPEIQGAASLTLIHNACAPFSPAPIHQLQWREVEENLAVAVKGGWLCAQALIRPMIRAGHGTIVNILTDAVCGLPPRGFAAYVTAKHALRGLTMALASELAPRGLRVFSVSPGFMHTSLTERWETRWQEAIRAGASRITVPAQAGRRILELVDGKVPGNGEDYPV